MPLANLLFPRKCLGCGQLGAYFCSQCLNSVFLKDQRICPVCQNFSVGGQTHRSCQKPYSLDGLTSIFAYRGVLQKAIKKLKYRFVTDLAADLVELFLSFCGEDRMFTRVCQNASLVPIPLHSSRQRWRGFNQAELLGKMMADNLGIQFLPNLLVRTKKTRPQVELDKKERQQNISGAFKLNPNCKLSIVNCKFILFDDVWTSGATLKEAAKILKSNGAKLIWGLTLAR